MTHILDYYFQTAKIMLHLVTKDHNESHYDFEILMVVIAMSLNSNCPFVFSNLSSTVVYHAEAGCVSDAHTLLSRVHSPNLYSPSFCHFFIRFWLTYEVKNRGKGWHLFVWLINRPTWKITSPRSHVCEYVIVCAIGGFCNCFPFNKIYQLKL